ncbi:MAG: transglutaminase domain-containing protein [Sedimentisphaerales bacterium]|nr:transglutaminase domain-containing protein [Sedimentisphaerales bacterium]
MNRSLSVFVLLASLASGSFLMAATEEVDYMAILMDGKKIGHAVHTRRVEASRVTTIEQMNLLIGRGPAAIQFTGTETSVENTSGKPVAFEIVQSISGMEQKRKGTINSGKVRMTIQNGPSTEQKVFSYPRGALMAEGLRLLQMKMGLEPGLKYETLMFRPDMDQALPAQVEVGSKTRVDLFGRMLELSEVKVSMYVSGQSITVTSYVDDSMKAHKSIVPMMGMQLELIACDKEFAMSQDSVVDFLDKLSVVSPSAISQTDLAGPITYELTATTDNPLILPSTNSQTVKEIAPGRFQLTIQPVKPQEGIKYPYDGTDAEIKKFTDPAEYLQSKDAKILDLVKYAVTSTDDAAKAVFQIENFVKGYITKKDLSVGYASAAEVAQTRQGDCSEHAILAAAMCRAAGIPARVVCGVVYVEALGDKKNVFGGHMWAEAYIGDKWIPLDPTRAPNGFSAGHIALACGNGEPIDFFSMVNTLGCFKIDKVILPSQASKPAAGQLQSGVK